MSKPQPVVNEVNQPFFAALEQQRVLLQRCIDCDKSVFYPRVCCPYCRGADLEWVEATGRGRILTHTTIHRPHHAGFDAEVPYVFAAVDLTDGAMIYGQLIDAPLSDVSFVGRRVEPVFQATEQGRALLAFKLADDQE